MSIVERERVETEVVTPPVTTKDVLHRAADLLEEFGWCQGNSALAEDGEAVFSQNFETDKRRRVAFCHNGAIKQAKIDLGFHGQTGWGDDAAFRWNDEPGRTKAEVVTRLRNAAESL